MNFLRKVVNLCASFRAYQAVCVIPLTRSIKYLVKLMTLLGLILMVTFIPVLLGAISRFGKWADATLPAFRIQDGKVHSEIAQPYVGGDANFRVILDTTGKITAVDSNATQGILIKADTYEVWMTESGEHAQIRSREATFRGFPDGEVNRRYLRRLIQWMLPVGLPLAFLIAVLLGLLMTLLQSYLFAVVGSMMERSGPNALPMTQLLNIAIHAVTPGAVIVTAYMAMRLEGLNLGLIYLVVYAIFLLGATNACRPRADVEVEP